MTYFNQMPLQRAIFQVLGGDTTLAGMVSGVYDRPMQGTAFPYITFGAWEGQDWSSMTGAGVAFSVLLQVWSREGGHKQAALVMERLHGLLHEASPVLEAGNL